MATKQYCIYILTNKVNTVLYTGVTNSLIRRVYEHRHNSKSSFTSRYNVNKLVYFEVYDDINEAIKREKQIKGGSKIKKLNLIKSMNPMFRDLHEEILK